MKKIVLVGHIGTKLFDTAFKKKTFFAEQQDQNFFDKAFRKNFFLVGHAGTFFFIELTKKFFVRSTYGNTI